MTRSGIATKPIECVGMKRRAAPLLASVGVALELEGSSLQAGDGRLLALTATAAIDHDVARPAPIHARRLDADQWQHELQQCPVAFIGTAVAAAAMPLERCLASYVPAHSILRSYCTRWRKTAELDRGRLLSEVHGGGENRCKLH
jgi:hypothetical protein